uniref:Fibronectin type III domain-containing protein n=2 Tax=Breznakiella homolactica TaxID=2798577 RepID=A0A7T8BAC5_9SPIR
MKEGFFKVFFITVFTGILLLACSNVTGGSSPPEQGSGGVSPPEEEIKPPESTEFAGGVTVTFEESTTSLSVNWNPHQGVADYTVHYAYWDGGPISDSFGPVKDCSATIDNGIVENVVYNVRIEAKTISGASFWSRYYSVDTGDAYTITYNSYIESKGNMFVFSSRNNSMGKPFSGSTITIFVTPFSKIGMTPDPETLNDPHYIQYVLDTIKIDGSTLTAPFSSPPVPSFNMPAKDIALAVTFKELPENHYMIYRNDGMWDPSIGYFYFDPPYAKEGDPVTVYVKAAEQFELTELFVGGTSIDFSTQDPQDVVQVSFTMPSNHVYVDARGVQLPQLPPQ